MEERASYDSVGTATTAATLTAAYTGNTATHVARLFERLHLDIKYTPKSGQTDRTLYILVEVSNDNGTTYFPMSAKQTTTDSILDYVKDADGNIGIPIRVPGDLTSTGGTAYTSALDFDISGDFVKVSAKESGSANFGTLYLRSTLTSA